MRRARPSVRQAERNAPEKRHPRKGVSAKRGKSKKIRAEYRMLIFHSENERTRERELVFRLETLKEFVTFLYRLRAKFELDERLISIKILGLYAPTDLMPGTGPAVFEYRTPELFGKFDVSVTNLDKKVSNFSIDIGTDSIRILHVPERGFLTFVSA